jgi:hypothetical protein
VKTFNQVDSKLFGETPHNLSKKVCLQYGKEDVFYLLSQRGKAIEIHVAAHGRKGKLKVREASLAMVREIPLIYEWCNMLIAPVESKSVKNMCLKIGFEDYGMIGIKGGTTNLMVVNYG